MTFVSATSFPFRHCVTVVLTLTGFVGSALGKDPPQSQPAADQSSRTAVSVSTDKFCSKVKISHSAKDILNALFDGNLQTAEQLAERGDGADPAVQVFRTAIQLAQTDLVDPLTRLSYTHDFQGGQLGAFVPNGRGHPASEFSEWFTHAAEQRPEFAPVVSDAICLGIALQLSDAVRRDLPIVLSDDILLSRTNTSRPTVDLGTPFSANASIPFEILCSKPEARALHRRLDRAMFLQGFGNATQVPFFGGGTWLELKSQSTKIDPTCPERWGPVFRDIAKQCSQKGRFSSGTFITIYACHEGSDGGWRYLLSAAKDVDPRDPNNKRAITNLKIAFAALCDALHTFKRELPSEKDSIFGQLKVRLEGIGDPKETQYAWEVAGLRKPA